MLKVRLLIESEDYSGAISEAGYLLKEDEDNLEALHLRGEAYYYLADHDVATRFVKKICWIYFASLSSLRNVTHKTLLFIYFLKLCWL